MSSPIPALGPEPSILISFAILFIEIAKLLNAAETNNTEEWNNDVTIAAGSGIIAGPCKDVGGDIGVGTGGTEVSSIVFQTESEIGDNVELVSVGGFYILMHGGSSIANGITMTA